jgi:hypothetical protein
VTTDGAEPAEGWEGKWKWLVPLAFGVSLLAIGGFVAAIFGFIKSSDAYTGALARASSSEAVVSALGTPIKDGFFVTGNLNMSDAGGSAKLSIPVSGPKSGATIFVEATKRLGAWHYDHMIVQVDATRQRIDLSEPPPAAGN